MNFVGATSTTAVGTWMIRRFAPTATTNTKTFGQSLLWIPPLSQPPLPQFILTPTLLTIGTCRRCWMSGQLQSFYWRIKNNSLYTSSSSNSSLVPTVQRIQTNVARLYARRILDIAMASAALQRYKQQQLQQVTLLQQSIPNTTTDRAERPTDWVNWQRKRSEERRVGKECRP